MLSGEAANTNLTVFGMTWPGLEPMITLHTNHYTPDVVVKMKELTTYHLKVSTLKSGNE